MTINDHLRKVVVNIAADPNKPPVPPPDPAIPDEIREATREILRSATRLEYLAGELLKENALLRQERLARAMREAQNQDNEPE